MLRGALATAGAHEAPPVGTEHAVLPAAHPEIVVRIASQRRFHLGSVLPCIARDGGSHLWLGHPAAAIALSASTPRTTARHRSHPTRHHDVPSEPACAGQSLQHRVPTLNTDKCEQKETGNQLNLKHNELHEFHELFRSYCNHEFLSNYTNSKAKGCAAFEGSQELPMNSIHSSSREVVIRHLRSVPLQLVKFAKNKVA